MIVSDTSIKQPVFITMVMLLVIVVGTLAFNTMPVNLLPDIDVPVSVVTVEYPGAGPETVADQVAKPLEDELTTLNGVSRITSQSSEGTAQVIVEFEQEVDPVQGLQDVRERVNLIRGRLPADIEDPTFLRFDPNASPIIVAAITSKSGMGGQELRQIVDDDVVPSIQQANGVGSVEVRGGVERQINVNLDLNRLQAYRILPSQVSQAIINANVNRGLGDVNVGGTEVNLRSPSVIQQPADIARIGIPGTPYDIGDVAVIEDGVEEVNLYSRLNGNDSLTLEIRKQSGTNTVAVGEAGLEALSERLAEFPDLEYVVLSDQADEVNLNIDGALEEIFFAVLFAMVVVMFFFSGLRVTLLTAAVPTLMVLVGFFVLPPLGVYVGHIPVLAAAAAVMIATAFFTSRNTAVTILGLPIIIIGTFAAISAFGLTINILTMLAISVSVGLVIDDAIVVRENIFRWMERGLSPKVAASRGTAEVTLSVIAMTLTIIAVFLPATFTTGVTGIIFFSFGITVACAMALSLFEAFTLAPMISAYFFSQKDVKEGHAKQTTEEETSGLPLEAHEQLGAMERFYERVLNWALRRRLLVMALALGVLVLSIVPLSLGLVKFAFFPEQEQHQFGIGFELPPGTPLEVSDALAREAEAIIASQPGVEAFTTRVGGPGSPELVEFFVKLDRETATLEAQDRLRPLMPPEQYPQITFSLPSFNGASTDVTNRPIQARLLSSQDLDDVAPVIPQLIAAVESVPGAVDIDSTYTPGKPELRVMLDPARANDFGVSNNDIARTLRALVDGDNAGNYEEDGEDYSIVVRLNQNDRQDVNALRNLRIPIGAQSVPLSSLATLEVDSSPTTIRRADRQTEVIIGANNVNRNINEVQTDMQAALNSVALPEGTRIVFGGNTEDQAEGFTSLGIAMLLSVLFVYMVLASQFASFTQPLVIMLAMPLCFIGAFLALSLTRVELTIFGMIGFVMLLGLAVKNSILLVDFTNQLFRSGMEKNKAIERASAVRLRPILMTSAAIILGSLPAAIGFGEGGGLRRALAVVLIGGMITSTLLTLVVVPVAYSLLESLQRRLGNLRAPRLRRQPTLVTAGGPAAGFEPAPRVTGEGAAPRPASGPAGHSSNGDGVPGTNGHEAANGVDVETKAAQAKQE
jgi:HAE1 family hydrophobic/amphiphilic exporter-1